MEEKIINIIQVCYIIYPSGLLVLFIINLIYFFTAKQIEEDKLFEYSEFKYTHQNVYNRLVLLRKFLGKDLVHSFKKLEQYKVNSKRTKRTFTKYQDRIEKSFVLLYASKFKEKPVQFLFERLSKLFKFEIFYTTLFYPFVFIFIITYFEFESGVWKFLFLTIFLVSIYGFWLAFTRLLLTVKYTIIGSLIILFKRPVGKLRRNMNSLDYLYNTSHFNIQMYKLMYFAFIASLGAKAVKGGGTNTFKGGRFGGGGAGGSW